MRQEIGPSGKRHDRGAGMPEMREADFGGGGRRRYAHIGQTIAAGGQTLCGGITEKIYPKTK